MCFQDWTITPSKFHIAVRKMVGSWKTILSYWVLGNFSGAMFVKLWEGNDSNILYVLSVFLLAVCEIFVNTVAGKIGD